ncbi:MAG: DJ-1/PfpI family protein [Selenomonadaceae bacterium]|nr:DJ-1/PfpI family protein [Selenomonadaceae bacterium]
MKKAAIFLADGFEEGEALFTLDIIRRAGITCDSYSIGGEFVTSSRKITVKADNLLGDKNLAEYDMVILPGGQPGSTNLSKDERVLKIVRSFIGDKNKFVAAICAAPMVLKAAGVSKGRTLTSYPGENFTEMFSDANYVEDELVVQDGNLITSRAAATCLPFAYKIIDALGGDSEPIKKSMLYDKLTGK